jgi:hypothetical protein
MDAMALLLSRLQFAFPQSILYDNTKLAVAKIVKSGKRLR